MCCAGVLQIFFTSINHYSRLQLPLGTFFYNACGTIEQLILIFVRK